MLNKIRNFLKSKSALFLTLGIVPILEMFITVQWGDLNCVSGGDGPLYFATGFPFPYVIYSGVSSLEFYFMLHVYLLNLAILCLCIYPLMRVLCNLIQSYSFILSGLGLISFIFLLSILILLMADHGLIPVRSIAITPNGSYFNLRPVSVSFDHGEQECRLSAKD